MKTILRPALTLLVLFTLLTGIAYPFAVTGAAQILFPRQANGSLITQNGQVVGSELIGQNFDAPKYFWGRLSATSPNAYNAASSSGSNFGPLNDDFKKAVRGRVDDLKKADPTNTAPVPADLVTASASGLDAEISPEAAAYQVARVAKARGLSTSKVEELVAQNTSGRTLGLLGEARVNVLKLNLALDGTSGPSREGEN